MITVLTDKAVRNLGQRLFEGISGAHGNAKHFLLADMDIKPCYACRGCEERTFLRCVVRDDADLILPYITRSKAVTVLTPITFGSYSFQAKRVIDKLALIGDPHYYYKNGELVKRLNPEGIKFYAIGVCDGEDPDEIQAFKDLVAENLTITGWRGKPIIIPQDTYDMDSIVKEITE